MPPRNKLQRADAFEPQTPAQQPGSVPYISAAGMNTMYETGASGLSMKAFEDPVQKENEVLKGQLADLMEQLEGRTSDLAVQDGTLLVHGFQLSPTGLIAPETFSEEAWQQIGHLLFRLEGSLQWLIGDWLNYGGAQWGDATKFAQTFGRDPGTLHNYAFVSREIQFSFRNENLPFTHHLVVANAKLTAEQQQYALAIAVEQKMSVAKLRQWIKEQLGEQSDIPALSTESMLNISGVARDMEKFWLRDPSTAKKKDHEKARQIAAEARQALEAFERKWGIR